MPSSIYTPPPRCPWRTKIVPSWEPLIWILFNICIIFHSMDVPLFMKSFLSSCSLIYSQYLFCLLNLLFSWSCLWSMVIIQKTERLAEVKPMHLPLQTALDNLIHFIPEWAPRTPINEQSWWLPCDALGSHVPSVMGKSSSVPDDGSQAGIKAQYHEIWASQMA